MRSGLYTRLVKVYNEIGYLVLRARVTATTSPDVLVAYEAWYKDLNYNVNYTVKAIPSDMGKKATGNRGLAFHDNFVNIVKV